MSERSGGVRARTGALRERAKTRLGSSSRTIGANLLNSLQTCEKSWRPVGRLMLDLARPAARRAPARALVALLLLCGQK